MRGLEAVVFLLLSAASCERPADEPPRSEGAAQAGPSEMALEARCRDNDADACDVLGARYLVGHGVDKDETRAHELRRKALALLVDDCAKGDAQACARMPPPATPRARPAAVAPATPSAGPDDAGPLGVEIRKDGSLWVDAAVRTEAELGALAKTACTSSESRVVIRADESVPHATVIRVLDVLKQSGCAKIAFGVTPLSP